MSTRTHAAGILTAITMTALMAACSADGGSDAGYHMAHIEGAVPAPYYANREEVVASLPRDGTWIVAYCECPRAAADSVVKWLREEGKFTNTAVLYEGIQGWVSLGYPVVAGDASKPAP